MDQAWRDLLSQGPLVAMLIFFLYGFWRGWWVFGREFENLRESAGEWKSKAERATDLAEKSVTQAEKGIPPDDRATLEDVIEELRRLQERGQ